MLGGLETNSWPGSHLAYWPKHIHEGTISSTDSLFFSFIHLSLLLCQPSTMSSLTYRQRTNTQTRAKLKALVKRASLEILFAPFCCFHPHPMSRSS